MSFLNGKPFVVTKSQMSGRWNGWRDNRTFRCFFCGDFFSEGDTIRFIYMNDTNGICGNRFVCSHCDGPNVKERMVQRCNESEKFWWLRNEDDLPPRPENYISQKDW